MNKIYESGHLDLLLVRISLFHILSRMYHQANWSFARKNVLTCDDVTNDFLLPNDQSASEKGCEILALKQANPDGQIYKFYSPLI